MEHGPEMMFPKSFVCVTRLGFLAAIDKSSYRQRNNTDTECICINLCPIMTFLDNYRQFKTIYLTGYQRAGSQVDCKSAKKIEYMYFQIAIIRDSWLLNCARQ